MTDTTSSTPDADNDGTLASVPIAVTPTTEGDDAGGANTSSAKPKRRPS